VKFRPLTPSAAFRLSGGSPLLSDATDPPDARRGVYPAGRRSTPVSKEKAAAYQRIPHGDQLVRLDYHAEAQARAIVVGVIVLFVLSAIIALCI